ncbi:MAG: 1-phosphofructokinase [Bacillota bacterium]
MKAKVITVTLNPAIDKTITVDKFEYGQTNRAKDVRMDAGGKGINVAKVLHQFNQPVIAEGLIAGYQGTWIENRLQAMGIACRFHRVEGETRTNTKVVDLHTKVTTEVNEQGFQVDSVQLIALLDSFAKDWKDAEYLVLAGSMPPGTPADYYKQLIQVANASGTKVILDADGEVFRQGLEGIPYAVKPNVHELENYFGQTFTTDEEILGAARQLIAKGIEIVQVSLGKDGSLIVNKAEAYRARPFPITPLSTVGAGDSMVATMVYGFLQEMNLEQIARWCSTAGTITASKSGTQVCTLEEVRARVEDISIVRI